MYYLVYKITNNINGKIYIGKHKTEILNDGYMGSGKLIKKAIAKYGIKNFSKDILFQFDNEEDMNEKESELVSQDFIDEDSNYNMRTGGSGGWSKEWPKIGSDYHNEYLINDPNYRKEYRKKVSEGVKNYYKHNKSSWIGRKHSEETKNKMRKSKNKGSENPQFGTMWITNGQENKKIKKDVDFIPEGWYKGRVIKRV
jgi:group I intron endonuclease